MAIKIPVSADFDSASVEQQLQAFQQKLNALGQQIAQANKAKFEPISKASLQDMQRMVQQFEALRRVSGDLNKRINATGQKGTGFVDLDWGALYPDVHSRNRQMAKAWNYVTGHAMVPPSQQPGQRPPPGAGGYGWQGLGSNMVQSGLRAASGATGGVGGVAAGAIGTGMSAGFGAGMMGLLGGMLALGVGKLVSAATEKIGQAEDNAVAYDRLKRTLGDVNVSFGALKGAIHDAAQNTRITYAETAKLGTEFAKLGNLTGDQYKGMFNRGGELEMGVGLSRSYGLEPEQGVGTLGRMRGLGITRNEQDTRRFALLIGETIGKSNAFAKADEVMSAIADYATMQTRSGMGGANVAGYAGMFSGLTASGIPGLDPAGAGSMLSRINASLTAGGAKGEASQFFSALVGNRMGLDPIQLQVLREGGAFATNDEAFGPNSVAARYGLSGPGGSSTFLSGTLDALRGAYGSNKGLLAQATSNHLGINMRQAMALLSTSPNQMGEMGKYADLTTLSGSGIGNLSKALYGSAADRTDLADSLARRTGAGALSATELARLDDAMKSGNAETQKQVLAELVASRDQERTQGSDIRDSKNLLDNIKVSLADKLIPLTEQMRAGIIYMAGGKDKLTTEDIMRRVIENDSKGRSTAIENKYDTQIKSLMQKSSSLFKDGQRAGDRELEEVNAQIRALLKEKKEQLEKENVRRQQEIDDMMRAAEERRKQEEAVKEENDRRKRMTESGPSGPSRYGSAPGGGGSVSLPGNIEEKLAAADAKYGLPSGTMKSIMRQETGGRSAEFLADPSKYHYGLDASGRRIAPHSGKVSTAFGPFGILESTAASPGYGVSPLKDKSFDSQLDFAAAYAAGRIKSAGSVRGGLAGYGEGYKYADSVMSRIGTPMPQDAVAATRMGDHNMNIRGSFDPLTITLQSPTGQPLAPTQYLNPNFSRATPFGQGG